MLVDAPIRASGRRILPYERIAAAVLFHPAIVLAARVDAGAGQPLRSVVVVAPFRRRAKRMRDENGIEAAARRLTQAIDALDAAIERRREAERAGEKFAEQLQVLGTDRSRLAAELAAAAASAGRLKSANRE